MEISEEFSKSRHISTVDWEVNVTMINRHKLLVFLSAIVILLLLAVGCASAPSSVPTPTPEPTPAPEPAPTPSPKEVELKYDDGNADGFCAQAPGWGYSVHFSPPTTPFTISKVRIMARLYGTEYADQIALLEIWGQDFDILYSCEMPAAKFNQSGDWATVETNITVDGDFRVVFFTNSSQQEGGISIGCDLSGINSASEVARVGGTIVDWIESWETGPHPRPRETTNWMIQAVGTFIES